jgi:hypothetical protein
MRVKERERERNLITQIVFSFTTLFDESALFKCWLIIVPSPTFEEPLNEMCFTLVRQCQQGTSKSQPTLGIFHFQRR